MSGESSLLSSMWEIIRFCNMLLTAWMSVPGVAESAVIGVPHRDFGEGVVAVVVREDGSEATEEDILAGLTDLARFKQPVAVEYIDEIPRNPSGKILKRVLREQFPGPAPA